MEPYEIEEFWDDLLAFIEQRRVIPVVGAELLTIQQGGVTIPLYRAVAEELLRRYGLPASGLPSGGLRERHELNDAVCAVAAAPGKGKRISDLYRPVHGILQKLISEQHGVLEPLRQLASIRHFDLFATTTPDNLLARALNDVRFDGTAQTDEIEYAPNFPTDRVRDIPEAPTSMYTAVFYPFGKADVFSFYAIHDEDALEFAYTLQMGKGPERMFSKLRSQNLLFIGCTFADSLSPFFLRSLNSERLFSDHRTKKESLVGEETNKSHDFVVFLERFSPNSRCYAINAVAFVDELYQRWSQRHPATPAQPVPITTDAKSGETIFISYSSDDIGAARRLNADLAEFGGDVAWFDKTELKPGTSWEETIRSAIQRCTFFLPLISSNTENRDKAFFHDEWTQAVEVSRRIRGRKFIFPIVIDPGYDGTMESYRLVPEQFRTLQYSHAPGGKMSEELKAELKEQLRTLRRGRAA